MVYFASGQRVKLDLSGIDGDQLQRLWYNPRNGEYSEVEPFEKSTEMSFITPTIEAEEDWVLLIRAKVMPEK